MIMPPLASRGGGDEDERGMKRTAGGIRREEEEEGCVHEKLMLARFTSLGVKEGDSDTRRRRRRRFGATVLRPPFSREVLYGSVREQMAVESRDECGNGREEVGEREGESSFEASHSSGISRYDSGMLTPKEIGGEVSPLRRGGRQVGGGEGRRMCARRQHISRARRAQRARGLLRGFLETG